MEALKQPIVEFDDGFAIIRELTLRNPDSVALVKRMRETEIEFLVDSMLSTIAKVGEGATTAQLMLKEFREYVYRTTREEFENLRKELRDDIKDVTMRVMEELKVSEREISDMVERNSSAIVDLIEKKIGERLQELSEKISIKEKEREIIEKTTLKGFDFETAVYEECRKLADGTEEVVDFLGQKQGALRRKTGDIVIVHATHDSRIKPKTVVECKDRDMSNTTAEEILAEIKEAIANRNADVCLYLFRTQEQMPSCFKPIKIGENFVIASCDMELSLLIRITKLVGSVVCRMKMEEVNTDVASALNELRNISALLEEFSDIQKLSQLASQHSIKISEKSAALKGKIERCVMRAIDALEKSPDKNRNTYIPVE
jgi:hypothetical protein